MLEPQTPLPPAPLAGWKKDVLALGLLLALVLPLRAWLLYTTEVAARDSIGYIRYALDFEALPWPDVCKKHPQHPGYALAVLAMSQPLRAADAPPDPATMQRAAQLVSVLASLLLLYPTYHLGRLLFDRRVGFMGALLYQYLPINAHHLTDGISEPLFLLLVAAALLQAVRAVQARSARRFGLCGLVSGLAYVTRPEGALVAAAAGTVLVGSQLVRARRLGWRGFVACALALALASASVGSVYVAATGRLTNKRDSVGQVLRWLLQPAQWLLHENSAGGSAGPAHGPGRRTALVATVPALTFKLADDTSGKVRRSAYALGIEWCNGLHYAGAVPALLGLGWSLGRLRRLPGAWVLALHALMHGTTLFGLAMTVAYVSDRHMMVLSIFGTILAAAGLCELPRQVFANFPSAVRRLPWAAGRAPAVWSLVLLGGFVGYCLPKTLQPLHSNRAGNHAAGLWLAGQVRTGDIVVDDHCWSHYYAGQVFLEGKEPPLPPGAAPVCYVVVTRSRDPEVNASRRDGEQQIQAANGEMVYHWPEDGRPEAARVVVYRRPRDMATHPWRTAAEPLEPPTR